MEAEIFKEVSVLVRDTIAENIAEDPDTYA